MIGAAADRTGRARRMALLVCRVLLGLLFVAAGSLKLAGPAEFARVIYLYHLLPDVAINPLALLLPWVEIFAGCAVLAVASWRAAGAVILAGLLVVFAAAIGLNLSRGIEAPCGCFAALSGPVGWWHFGGDVALAVVALGVALDGCRSMNWAAASTNGGSV